MSSEKLHGEELEGDVTFIKTPPVQPSKFHTGEDCGVKVTNVSFLLPHLPGDQLVAANPPSTC